MNEAGMKSDTSDVPEKTVPPFDVQRWKAQASAALKDLEDSIRHHEEAIKYLQSQRDEILGALGIEKTTTVTRTKVRPLIQQILEPLVDGLSADALFAEVLKRNPSISQDSFSRALSRFLSADDNLKFEGGVYTYNN